MPWFRLVIVSLLMGVGSLSLGAQTVSVLFPAAKQAVLRQLATTNADAKVIYAAQLRVADAALKSTPNPIAKIQSEGKLAKDPVKIATDESFKDLPKMRGLITAWVVTQDARYADKLRDFLVAWAAVNQPTGDPIDETNLELPILGYDVLKPRLSDTENAKITAWLTAAARAEIGSRKPGRDTSLNNWNSHRLKIVGLIGFALGNQEFINYTDREYKTQIQGNLYPDGSGFDFKERDALHYHLYTLEPLLRLAMAAKVTGRDWYGYAAPSGASLPKSVAWVLPFVKGEKTHAEYVNSKVQFDRDRANAGQKEFQTGRAWEPREATLVLSLMQFFDPSLLPLLQKASAKPGDYPTWEALLASVLRD